MRGCECCSGERGLLVSAEAWTGRRGKNNPLLISTCSQTGDQYWSNTDNGQNCLMAGPLGDVLRPYYNYPVSNLCQNQVIETPLTDNQGVVYGRLQRYTDYNGILFITIMLDGQTNGQLLYRWSDFSQYIKVRGQARMEGQGGPLAF
jgi:hypothetical protein